MKISASAPIFLKGIRERRQVRKPNLFIVGAPKCGTTSMHYYLSQHPDIYMSLPKEPFYFGSDLDSHQLKTENKREYYSFFEDANGEECLGESTVWYLYSKEASKEIRRFNPQSKIIIMLRNPVDAMYALHSQFLFSGNEPIEDFREALRAETRRMNSDDIDSSVYFPEGLLYSKVYSYPTQVKRYYDEFGRENVKVILLKDLKNSPEECYKSVLDFVEVDEYTPSDFQPRNSNCQLRSPFLRQLVRNVNGNTLGTLRQLVPVRSCADIWRNLKPLLVDTFNRSPLDQTLRKRIYSRFAEQIESLEKLIHRDLTHWKMQ